jgi:hypothetical protein
MEGVYCNQGAEIYCSLKEQGRVLREGWDVEGAISMEGRWSTDNNVKPV